MSFPITVTNKLLTQSNEETNANLPAAVVESPGKVNSLVPK